MSRLKRSRSRLEVIIPAGYRIGALSSNKPMARFHFLGAKMGYARGEFEL